MRLCHADPPTFIKSAGPNYLKPHVPVAGLLDGRPQISCLFCGAYLDGKGHSTSQVGQRADGMTTATLAQSTKGSQDDRIPLKFWAVRRG